MSPDPSLMSTDGLLDAAQTSTAALLHEEDFSKRVEQKRWLMRYLSELHRRAYASEHELTLLRMSLRHAP